MLIPVYVRISKSNNSLLKTFCNIRLSTVSFFVTFFSCFYVLLLEPSNFKNVDTNSTMSSSVSDKFSLLHSEIFLSFFFFDSLTLHFFEQYPHFTLHFVDFGVFFFFYWAFFFLFSIMDMTSSKIVPLYDNSFEISTTPSTGIIISS